jgi:hypothetical protein
MKISKLDFDLGEVGDTWSTAMHEAKQRRAEARRVGVQDDGISLQEKVIEFAESGFWKALGEWKEMSGHVHGAERNLLLRAATLQGALRITIDKDWKKLLEIKKRCEDEGFRLSTR